MLLNRGLLQDMKLKRAVEENKSKNWKEISRSLAGRTDAECLARWQKVNPNLVKGPWTPEVRVQWTSVRVRCKTLLHVRVGGCEGGRPSE